ncbi:mitotic checkpoint regulator, MAD2B-interacting-domain-containing protein [Staphylotrichum tortipilum]|uniref:Mitotic checkpoint regulator, MAD2B-interacting-domain-containing protein n=1 Tax=Staphylotrichum tortipilum TaxID=2831512 RepID=A0AAN6MGK7_9PEZI|nr:mitotic checkpoint regulator, MAD2B-interacting-domain-containing protein [Staphylotrichum longicolle]
MGLVEYSDSESEGEPVQQKSTPAPAPASKKPFQKLLDRSSGAGKGKILVNLSAASAAPDTPEDSQPPAKRAKIAGGSRFSALGSFLPPPKKTGLAASTPSARATGTTPAPGVHLRTAAEPAFSRRADGDGDSIGFDGDTTQTTSKGPSIPEGQKPEEEVKLVGKPLMFKPLSVARKKAPLKTKKKDSSAVAAGPTPSGAPRANITATTKAAAPVPSAPLPKKKISLFSIDDDEPATTAPAAPASAGAYEPVFTSAPEPAPTEDESNVTSAYPSYHSQPTAPVGGQYHPNHEHEQAFSSLADTLSPAARRELFGRSNDNGASRGGGGVLPANAKVITFDMEREYDHNEALRASGAAQQVYNPVRSIAPGKHSLRQVVNMAQSNQGALEESFARAKSNQKDAAGRYGW